MRTATVCGILFKGGVETERLGQSGTQQCGEFYPKRVHMRLTRVAIAAVEVRQQGNSKLIVDRLLNIADAMVRTRDNLINQIVQEPVSRSDVTSCLTMFQNKKTNTVVRLRRP